MFLGIIINSLVLFILVQSLGVPLSNLMVLESKYDVFAFSEENTTAGENLIYNMVIPNLYVLCLYGLDLLGELYEEPYLIVGGYILIRYFVIVIILGRFYLLKIKYEIILVFLTLTATYLVNTYIILKKISLIVPIEEFKNEMSLLFILFLYKICKKVIVDLFRKRNDTTNRKKYVDNKFKRLYSKYNKHISKIITERVELERSRLKEDDEKKIALFLYSIMIYEDFARPRFLRYIENLTHKLVKTNYSLGIMQFRSKYPLNDEGSISFAIALLFNICKKEGYQMEEVNFRDIANSYNISDDSQYSNEVLYIYEILIAK